MTAVTDREWAAGLDREDPLAPLRERFWIGESPPIYLDGNSLGMLPKRSLERLEHLLRKEWGSRLVRAWDDWIDLPIRVGDLLGRELLGAGPGQVVVADSTTVNLYKLAAAAVEASPGRSVIVSDRANFPTDRYVLEGLARQRGLELRLIDFPDIDGPDAASVAAVVDSSTALLSLSHVDYRSGALADMAEINRVAHGVGAPVLWDLCHSVGAVPIDLDRAGTDLAAGCTYKYLNAGPGSPAFMYVRQELQEALRQPIWGWFGQTDQFAMGQGHQPVPGIGRFLSGSPAVIGSALVEEGARLLATAGMEAIRAKNVALTSLLIELSDRWLQPLGFELATPRDPRRRGSQVSLRHSDAYRICRTLIDRYEVVVDFRAPDRLRLGLAAPTTRFVDVYDAAERIRQIVLTGSHLEMSADPARIT